MSTDDFVTRLGAQLYEAALREERRGSLGSRLAGLRYAMPRGAAVAAGAFAVVLVAAVIALGGLDWGADERVTTPKVIRTFTIADNLGFMGTGFGSVWAVDNAQGQILRVNPRSGKVEARIPSGRDAVLNVGAGAVWVVEPTPGRPLRGRLARIEPATGRVTSRVRLPVPAGGPRPPTDLQIVGGVPWVVAPGAALRIDPETGRPVQRIEVRESDGEPFPFATAVGEDGLWVLTRDQRIVRYDLDSGRPAEELPARLPGAVALNPTPDGLLVATREGEIALADGDDGRLVWRKRIGTSVSAPPGAEGDTVLAHVSVSGRDRLVALDLATGETRYTVALPEFGISGATNVGRQIWIAATNGKVMVIQR